MSLLVTSAAALLHVPGRKPQATTQNYYRHRSDCVKDTMELAGSKILNVGMQTTRCVSLNLCAFVV